MSIHVLWNVLSEIKTSHLMLSYFKTNGDVRHSAQECGVSMEEVNSGGVIKPHKVVFC